MWKAEAKNWNVFNGLDHFSLKKQTKKKRSRKPDGPFRTNLLIRSLKSVSFNYVHLKKKICGWPVEVFRMPFLPAAETWTCSDSHLKICGLPLIWISGYFSYFSKSTMYAISWPNRIGNIHFLRRGQSDFHHQLFIHCLNHPNVKWFRTF